MAICKRAPYFRVKANLNVMFVSAGCAVRRVGIITVDETGELGDSPTRVKNGSPEAPPAMLNARTGSRVDTTEVESATVARVLSVEYGATAVDERLTDCNSTDGMWGLRLSKTALRSRC